MDGLTITRVSETKKGRMALFCEEGFLFSLDGETYHFHPVAEGQTLTAPELEQLRQLSDTRKAKDKALDYLGLRAYGSTELYDKLCTRFDEHSAAAAVARMNELGLLNDGDFARRMAASCKSSRRSRRDAAHRLFMKGLDRELIEEALDEVYGDGTEEEAVLQLIERAYASKLRQGRLDNVRAALARRGFPASVIREALHRWQEENSVTSEEEGWEEP